MARTRVLVVDDSAFMRRSVGRMLGAVPTLEVVGDASNGEEGLRLARELRPDVITLDVEMDVLDGLAMLERLMLEMPTRVVMLSSKTTENAKLTLDALDRGAIDFVAKPTGPLSIDLAQVGDDLRRKIEAAVTMSETAFGRHCRIAVGNVTRARAEAASPRRVSPRRARSRSSSTGRPRSSAICRPCALPPIIAICRGRPLAGSSSWRPRPAARPP